MNDSVNPESASNPDLVKQIEADFLAAVASMRKVFQATQVKSRGPNIVITKLVLEDIKSKYEKSILCMLMNLCCPIFLSYTC